ncbi:MAG: uridine kinase [Candidatus Marinimicrobia bacterium]|nr:uridine kinase [Candidatus Neomarinimicrobiota bacterium]
MKSSILIGIAGGTASGKTSLAKNISKNFNEDNVCIIEQDSYYFDVGHMPQDMLHHHNFDHPDSYDFELMIKQLKRLLDGGVVNIPIYDYTTHTRSDKTREITGHKIIILEGILTLVDKRLRDLMDIKVYVEAPDDIRFIRRLQRDIEKRGRSVNSVIEQYLETVRPMHQQFIETSKKYADLIIPQGGHNKVAIDLLTTKINSLVNNLRASS